MPRVRALLSKSRTAPGGVSCPRSQQDMATRGIEVNEPSGGLMANEQPPSWWKSLPGILTAATGFVAAMSGLVAGLNQLGVFRREEPPPQVVGTAPAARESTSQEMEPLVSSGASSTAGAEAR